MERQNTAVVSGVDGARGTVSLPEDEEDRNQVKIQLENGGEVWAPYDLLEAQPDGSYQLPLKLSELESMSASPTGVNEVATIPIIEETLSVKKRQVTTGRWLLTKRVHERQEEVDEPGYREKVEIERVPRDETLEEPVKVRFEGDTMIIPVMEEVLVIEKRLVLKEEVRVTKSREEVRKPQHFNLRKEEILVERLDEEPGE